MAGDEIVTYPALFNVGSNKRKIRASALDQDTLKADTEVTVWAEQIQENEIGFFGHGPSEREYAEAFTWLDLVASGNGSGAAGDNLTGDVVLAITDSRQKRVIKSVVFDSLGELRDAKAEKRTARPVMAAMAPYAESGRHLEIRLMADSNSDGKEVDPENSGGHLYHTLV